MTSFAASGLHSALLLAGQLSPPVQLHRVLTAIQSDPLALATDALVLTVLVGYLGLRLRLRHEGSSWSNWRTAGFAAGLLTIFVATGSGVAAYEDSSFPMHVVQHLLLVTLAPILLALGAPLTLALQASRGRAQSRVSAALQSGLVETISFPVFAAILAYLTTAVYFLTPLYGISEGYAYLHGVLQLCFLVVGCIYWWPVVGLDPTRWKMSYPMRLAYLATGIPINSLIGVELTLNRSSIDRALYSVSDTHTGGAVLWGVSVLVTLAGIAVMYWKWAGLDARQALSSDLTLDRQLGKDPARGLAGGIIMDPRTGLWHYPADEAPSTSGPSG
ncbi:MAG: cytochrome c oxidase assembly protein [Acidimicrobiales bacterium]